MFIEIIYELSYRQVINVKIRRMNAAMAYAALGYVGLLSCVGIISRFGRQASPGEHGDLRPYGLSPFGIRNTGQNASKAQDAFRSLHYVAVTTCRPQLVPPQYHFPCSLLGDRPHASWGQVPKSVLKTISYPNIPRSYRLKR